MPTEQELREEIERAGKLERRVYDFGLHLEERADPVQDSNMTKGGPMISGHASVFNVPVDLGYFTETVKPGAFKRTIVEDDIRALFNHNPDYVLGRNTAGTLDLREVQVSIKRKDITQASIGFYARGYTLRKDDQGVWYRDLTDIMLYDVSPVTFPAFTATDMNVRSAQQIAATFRERPPEDLKPAEETWKRELEHRRRMLQLVRD
jgi:phage head maturation protease